MSTELDGLSANKPPLQGFPAAHVATQANLQACMTGDSNPPKSENSPKFGSIDSFEPFNEICRRAVQFGSLVCRVINQKREICEKYGRLPDVKAGSLEPDFRGLRQSLDSIDAEDLTELPAPVLDALRSIASVARTWPNRATVPSCLAFGEQLAASGERLKDAIKRAQDAAIATQWAWVDSPAEASTSKSATNASAIETLPPDYPVQDPGRKQKRSTARGDAREKIIAALTNHHKYADGGCLNLEPIANNLLAKVAGVSPSTASKFFNDEFNQRETGGHAKYCAICRTPSRLVVSLKALRGEFSPHDLYGRCPPGEDDRGDVERDE